MCRHGYHPDDQCPDYGDGPSWQRAVALHYRTRRPAPVEAAPLARCAVTSSANGSGESLHSAGGAGTAGVSGPAADDEVTGRQIDLFGRLAR